jgi:hypothetical protein
VSIYTLSPETRRKRVRAAKRRLRQQGVIFLTPEQMLSDAAERFVIGESPATKVPIPPHSLDTSRALIPPLTLVP